MAEPLANSGNPDQTPRSAASDLDLHFLPITILGVSRLQWIKGENAPSGNKLIPLSLEATQGRIF